MSGTIHLSLSVWLLSLTTMSPSFLHVVARVRVSILFKTEEYSVKTEEYLLIEDKPLCFPLHP